MTHKHHDGLEASWKVPMYRRHYAEIFVWADKPLMYAANDYNESVIHPGRVAGHDFLGLATAGIMPCVTLVKSEK